MLKVSPGFLWISDFFWIYSAQGHDAQTQDSSRSKAAHNNLSLRVTRECGSICDKLGEAYQVASVAL
jgi:hypothetical protein